MKQSDSTFNQILGRVHFMIFDLRLFVDFTKLRIMSMFMKLLTFVGYIQSLEQLGDNISEDNEKI